MAFDEIEVPVIEIANGWTVDDLQTVDDCDDAFAVLTGIIASIDEQMDRMDAHNESDTEAFRKAKAALRWKKAAMGVVNRTAGRIKRREIEARETSERERMIHFIKAKYPDAFDDALTHYKAGLLND